MAEDTFTGVVIETGVSSSGKPKFKLESGGRSKTIFAGNYEGTLPTMGQTVAVRFTTLDPQPGRKWGTSILEDWSPAEPLPSNGSAPAPQRGYFNEDFTAARWALSQAVEIKEKGLVVDNELKALAALLLEAARDLTEQPGKEPTDTEPDSSAEQVPF